MNGSLKDALKQRLDENYGAYMRLLQTRTVPELIAMAPEITAAQQLHEELLGVCDEDDAAFLLQFDDPLDVVRGYWAAEITGYDHSGEMGHMLWEIRDREMYEKAQPVQSAENGIGAVQGENLTERGNPVSDVRQITTDDLRHPNVKPRTQTFSSFFEIFQGHTLRSYLGHFYYTASIQKSFIFQTIST